MKDNYEGRAVRPIFLKSSIDIVILDGFLVARVTESQPTEESVKLQKRSLRVGLRIESLTSISPFLIASRRAYCFDSTSVNFFLRALPNCV
jgi:hypothetical protein